MNIQILNVAEKPSVAKGISGILSSGNQSKRMGFSKFNPIHTFWQNFKNQKCKMHVTSVTGHIMNYEFDK